MMAFIGAVAIGTIVVTGIARLSGGDERSVQASLDTLTRSLIDTRVDVAEKCIEDDDFTGAVRSAESALRLESTNAKASAIRARAIAALQAIDASIAEARRAIAAGDAQAASQALEDAMSKDPNNALVADLSAQLNDAFEQRAARARSSMRDARHEALQMPGAQALDAFVEGSRVAAGAEKDVMDGKFARAAQSFLAARRAYARATRSAARASDDAAITRAELTTSQTPVASAEASTPPGGPSYPGGIENRLLETSIASASFTTGSLNLETDLDLEVFPSPLRLDWPFRVQVFVRNGKDQQDVDVERLTVTVSRNGAVTVPHVQLQQKSVKAGRRDMIASIPGAWLTGTSTWEFSAEVRLKNGMTLRRHIRLMAAPAR